MRITTTIRRLAAFVTLAAMLAAPAAANAVGIIAGGPHH
jgi:hypothetical protein